ncbi:MAG: DUF4331 domain-containing protein [Beijerinckiaceae bacterium]|nr:DUF4331 domain-containing protein [Beijerinckiaceae bacterium]
MRHPSRLVFTLLACQMVWWGTPALAASHREAPRIALDPSADNTDVYAFVSYDAANLARAPDQRRATFILNVIPGQDPSDGPNYFEFDDTVRYAINIDNDKDGKANDVIYEFFFKTQNRPGPGGLTSPLPYLGNPHIPPTLQLDGITSLDGPGSEGLLRRQTYRVFEIRNGVRRELFAGRRLFAVPSNVGPATMPNYPALAAQGIYSDGDVRVFAGQRAETFYIDLGAVFDTLNLRRFLPVLSSTEDVDTVNPFGINRFSGFNVHTIAIEVPIGRITSDGKPASSTRLPVIGTYGETARRITRILRAQGEAAAGEALVGEPPFVQVSRMGNPLVNELILTTPFKDRWNAEDPENEAQFQAFYKNPVIATALNLVFGVPIVPIDGSPANNRTDLMSILLKYPGQPLNGGKCGNPCAELLRLNLRVPPTPPEAQNRLGAALSTDRAGWPNGRRPNDDVTDIAIRVVGGTNYIANRVGDGTNFLAGAPGVVGQDITANGIAKNFPFLPTPYDGKNRRHVDCNETGPGQNPCGPPVP